MSTEVVAGTEPWGAWGERESLPKEDAKQRNVSTEGVAGTERWGAWGERESLPKEDPKQRNVVGPVVPSSTLPLP